MNRHVKCSKDPYVHSLAGLKTVAFHTFAPAIDSSRINKAWDQRLGSQQDPAQSEDRRDGTRALESWLARYFAPGRCNAS